MEADAGGPAPEDALLAALEQALASSPERVLLAVCVFARIGAAFFLLPGFGAQGLSMRVRLGAALAAAWIVVPVIAPSLADRVPGTPAALLLAIGAEATAGLVIGLAFRALVFALQIAGGIAAAHLSIAHLFQSPTAPEAEASVTTLLTVGGVALAMIAGLHVDAVVALVRLYDVLPFALMPEAGEAAGWWAARVGEAFGLGLSLALPFVLVSLAYNLALGALSRAMPQLLVALVGAPLLVLLGLGALWLSIPELMARWGGAMGLVAADPLGGLGAGP
ncbi:MAG: flagellar biosynthetic protein FliR [Paracoccaceae bacterium]